MFISFFTVIDYEELSKAIEKDQVLVIDVRKHSEMEETGKLPKSHSIPRKVDVKVKVMKLDRDLFRFNSL